MFDALVISDTHLGSDNCQARPLVHFLEAIRHGDLRTRRLILNGDVFDSIDFRRLRKQHWKVLSLVRKLSDQIEIVWINGNHDGPADTVSHLLGVDVRDEYVVESAGRRVMFLHGHRFDEFIERYPLTSKVADWMYRWLQRLDKSHTIARTAKHNSKAFLRNSSKIETAAIAYAAQRGCDAVCCGHTHHPLANATGPVHYFNSGCWTDRPCHYLTLADGVVELAAYHDLAEEPAEAEVPLPDVVPAVA
ncbi:MAG: UDP-2,3-diacylglucosamine diphosphatase [Fimbriiglobus sp.]